MRRYPCHFGCGNMPLFMAKIIKSKLNIFIIVFSAALLLVSLFAVDDPQKLLHALRYAKPGWLICAAFCMILYWFFDCGAVKLICKGLGCKISFYVCFENTMIGQLFNCITPFASGGQPMQIYHLSRHKVAVGQASCVMLAKFIVYQTALTLFAVLSVIIKFNFFIGKISGFGFMIFIGLLITCVIHITLIGIAFFPKITLKIIRFFFKITKKIKLIQKYKFEEKFDKELTIFFRDFDVIKKDLRILVLPLVLSAIQLIVYYTIPFFVCISLNIQGVDWFTVICAASFVTMIVSVVPLPGGSGGAEGGFIIFFQVFIRQAGVLAVAILLWRFFTFYLPILAGMFFTRKIRKEEPSITEAVEEL